MVKSPKKYFLTRTIELDNPSTIPLVPAIQKTERIDIPQDYDFLLGMLIIPFDTSFDENFRAGLRTPTKEILEITHNSFYAANSSVAPKEKFVPINERVPKDNYLELLLRRGKTYQPTATNPTNRIAFDVVFVLTDEEEWSKFQELKD